MNSGKIYSWTLISRATEMLCLTKAGIPTGQTFEQCGQGELLERISRHGFFLGARSYPDCRFNLGSFA